MNAVSTQSLNQLEHAGIRARLLTQEWLAPRLVALTLLAIVLSLVGERAGIQPIFLLGLNIVSYIAGGVLGAKSAIESLLEREIDVDLLMVLAALGAAAVGQWHEGAVLLFLFSLSNVLQDYAIGRSRKAIKSLFKLYPEVAKIRRGRQLETVPIGEIKAGDTVLIEPGERIPVDGEVIKGGSAVDESPITGESMPKDKSAGDRVFAGTLNKQGILDLRALGSAEQTTLSRIIQLVEEAQESKAPTERYLDRFEQRYAKVILLSVLLFIFIPPALGLSDFQSNFYRAMVLMTVASPCALVISVPSAFISAIASAARGGVLFKGGASLEQLASAKVIAFDKTGTLTMGEPKVTDLVCAPGITDATLMAVAASAEARSEHPLGKAIVAHGIEANGAIAQPEAFTTVPGQGISARLEGSDVHVGRVTRLVQAPEMPDELRAAQMKLEQEGKTVVAVLRDESWLGLIALADRSRAEAGRLIGALRELGIAPVMLTGDNERVAKSIAAELGIERVHAELLPEDKASVISELRQEFGTVVMVGDGINDAPALALADVGIAMGGTGTDVALETSNVVLMGDRLRQILDAIQLSARARRVVQQNILFSLGVIALLILAAFIAELPLPLGVLGHEGSTVIVVLNGLLSLLLLPEIRRKRLARGI
ncbi:MAG: heavy metal translocating P-type ATPase [Chloroflexi bacterium]|nr:heavy metal translocating P-type ATPase [Chloroflexota bacterium]